jgi:hypothetical protein
MSLAVMHISLLALQYELRYAKASRLPTLLFISKRPTFTRKARGLL